MAGQSGSTASRTRTIALGFSTRDREAIEREIEALIALLDEIDGDPDLEDDELHDDALDLGEDPLVRPVRPIYGSDQSQGPINLRIGYALPGILPPALTFPQAKP